MGSFLFRKAYFSYKNNTGYSGLSSKISDKVSLIYNSQFESFKKSFISFYN